MFDEKYNYRFFSIYLGFTLYGHAQTEKQLFKRAMSKMEEKDFEELVWIFQWS
ncbi:MAG: hypothetical protein R3B93_13605 [Bacteroidia bacterium]